MQNGCMGLVLEVNLSSGEIKSSGLSGEMSSLYGGCKGLAARLIYDLAPPGIDPLSPENVLIISTAPMTGTGAPSANRFNVTTKSPLTGGLADSNCGGNFGVFLKRAGYDILIIRGKAKMPVQLHIDADKVRIDDAGDLWGLDTEKTRQKLPSKGSHLVIGPAGENLVKYATIVCQERIAARAGVGTVMGSKNLKAVTAYGELKPQPHNPEKYKKSLSRWRSIMREHPVTGSDMPNYGTALIVNRTNAVNALPTRNFQRGSFELAHKISGETLAEKFLVKNTACFGCPIACGRQVVVGGKKVKGPEYETLGLLGANLEIADLEAINEWNYQADLLGLDTISLGGVLAYTMEAGEKGLLKTNLKFGITAGIAKAIEDIAYRRGLGDDMAEGTRDMADRYGGEDFAMQVKGLELAAYEPRGAVGQGLGYAIAYRGGCHIGSGYPVYFEAAGSITINALKTRGKAGLTVFNQSILEAISSMGCCIFTTYAANTKEMLKIYNSSSAAAGVLKSLFLYGGNLMGHLGTGRFSLPLVFFKKMFPQIEAHTHCTGKPFGVKEFFLLGHRVNTMGRLFNLREGFTHLDDTLPRRLTEELQRQEEPGSKVPLTELLPAYYKLKGWDKKGTPSPAMLKKLNINF